MASAVNPLVYALSHPKYREALAREFPFIHLGNGYSFIAIIKTLYTKLAIIRTCLKGTVQ